MKKYLVLILVLTMLLLLVACGGSDSWVTDPSSSSQVTTNNTEQPTDGTKGTTEATQVPTDEPASAPTEESTTAPTEESTTAPTEEPTTSPTQAPTETPTTPPTEAPATPPTTPPTTLPTTCSHSWKDATCTAPKTCTKCGNTEGNAVGHKWRNATCTVPKTCTKCGETEGTAAEHSWNKATCTTPKTCTKCGNTEGNAVGHKWSDASCTTSKTCTKCGTAEGSAAGHSWNNASCTAPKTCKTCGATEGSALGHSWNSMPNSPKTCARCGAAESSSYGYGKLANHAHGPAMQALYCQMFTACEAFAGNQKNISQTDSEYIIAQIDFDLSAMTIEDAFAVWKIFKLDNPRYYWLSNTVNVTGSTLELCIEAIYSNGTYRSNCDTAIANMAAACEKKLTPGMAQVEKAMAIHDFIIGQMNYAYESDGVTPQDDIWAHNLMGCAEKQLGVCEAYAKTYQYLCLRNGLECMVVTGDRMGNHAWNLIKLDGKWYGVDCTFDDTGTERLCYLSFGMSASQMKENYTIETPNGSGVNYLYELPPLTEHSIGLVNLYQNGNRIGLYLNIDAAFAAMTDPNSAYEIQLFDYGRSGSIVEYHLAATQTPKVKSLALRGNHIDFGNGYYTISDLMIDNDLILQSDLVIYDLAFYGEGSINLKNHKLSCLGNSVQFSVPITGSIDPAAPSELHIGIAMTSEFYSPVQIHTLSENADFNADITFRDNALIIKNKALLIRVFDTSATGISVQIDEFCPPASDFHSSINIYGPAKVKVDKITVPHEYVSIDLEFGALEEFGGVTIGSCNTEVRLVLDGQVTYVTTDKNGNEINRWQASVNPEDLAVPIATLLDNSIMDRLKIYFVDWDNDSGGGYHIDHTNEYMLNSKNQVILKTG